MSDPQHHHHQQPGHDTEGVPDETAMAELLDLDAEVLHAYLSDVTNWVHERAGDRPCRRIVDVGSGTGAGALALLQRFAESEVFALDTSEALLTSVAAHARERGVADRIHPTQANLDDGWPEIGSVDLVWASSSLHHMADPDRVLADVFAALGSGGLLVVAEMDGFPTFLPDDIGIGVPGLEARCHAAAARAHADVLPHLGSDWGTRIARAGFTVEAERSFSIDLTPPLPPATGRYARAFLQLIRSHLEGRISAEDTTTLDNLIHSDGPDGILQRGDLTVRNTRTVWVGRRP